MDQINISQQRQGTTRGTLPDQKSQQYLTFTLGREVFALSILNVKEIIQFGEITEIPMTPEFIRGIINLRGSVVPVIDLSSRFGRMGTQISRRTCIVIVEVERENDHRRELGVVVDAVNEVLEIPLADIEAPPALGNRIRSDLIQGMGKVDGKFVIILGMSRMLSDDELTMIDGVGDSTDGGAVLQQ